MSFQSKDVFAFQCIRNYETNILPLYPRNRTSISWLLKKSYEYYRKSLWSLFLCVWISESLKTLGYNRILRMAGFIHTLSENRLFPIRSIFDVF